MCVCVSVCVSVVCVVCVVCVCVVCVCVRARVPSRATDTVDIELSVVGQVVIDHQ